MLTYVPCCCFSHARLCVTLWTVAFQAPLSMGFSRPEYQSGLRCLPSGDLPDPGIEPTSLVSAALAGELFTTSAIVSVHAIYASTHGFINGYTVFLLGESQGRGSLVGCRLWGRTEVDTTGAT